LFDIIPSKKEKEMQMKYILVLLLLVKTAFATLIETELQSVQGDEATISIENIDVGVSGFVVKKLAPNHSSIINAVTVKSFDPQTHTAYLKLSSYTVFVNNNLPKGKWHAQKGDVVVLAFGYNRGLLIAPTEETYYTLKQAIKGENFVHPDVFATLLSYHGHPTPLQEDFQGFCSNVSIGLLFFYLEKHLYTVDCQSFKVLNIQNAPLKQTQKEQLPFYSRVKKIEANWFGKGSNELQDYKTYYYELLYENNPKNKQLIEHMKNSQDPKVQALVK
jgi:hypothetical protein